MSTLHPHVNRARPGVTALVPGDVLHVDAEPLIRLRETEGSVATAERVAIAREAIAFRMSNLGALHRAHDLVRLAREVDLIAAAAAPIGLTDLTVVAGHVRDCLNRSDPAALGATLARLIRLCGQALDLTAALRPPAG
jgi:hypothetical protein